MKKLFTSALVLALTLAATLNSSAITRRVTSSGATGPLLYADLTSAHSAAGTGDTIQVEPGTYSSFNCNKNLRFVGPGYNLGGPNGNAGLQAIAQAAIVQGLNVSTGAAGASFTGLQFTGSVQINTGGITLERCYVNTFLYLGGFGGAAAPNTVVRQCWVDNLQFSGSGNVYLANNLFTNGITGSTTWSGDFLNNNIGVSSFVQVNALDNFVVRNNIFMNNATYLNAPANTSTTFTNNIAVSTSTLQTGGTAANQNNVPMTTLFATPTAGSFDARYALRPNTASPAFTNPARGAGAGGTDVGMYGGVNPYRPSGIPNVPSVYQFDIPVSGGNINATISTRSNN